MFRHGMNHVVQKPDTGINGNDLALALLRGMVLLLCALRRVDLIPEIGLRECV
jgi:hypothetical protein